MNYKVTYNSEDENEFTKLHDYLYQICSAINIEYRITDYPKSVFHIRCMDDEVILVALLFPHTTVEKIK